MITPTKFAESQTGKIAEEMGKAVLNSRSPQQNDESCGKNEHRKRS